ncbi:MAG: hypothetical protein LAT82_00830 [Nanoarchaeota archaeon]|nr:hypothetical protein [Nanoarchaeota archaeon]
MVVTGVVTNLIAPFLFNINYVVPYIVSATFAVSSLVITFLLKESLNIDFNLQNSKIIKKVKKKNLKLSRLYFEIVSMFKFPIICLFKNKYLVFILLFSIIFGGLISIFGDLFNQPLIKERFGIEIYGIIFALATIIQSLIVWNSSKIITFFEENLFIVVVVVWFSCLIAVILMHWLIVILVMGVM